MDRRASMIAIQGHLNRGNEVIQILKNLGGKNREELTGRRISQYYFINCNGDIDLNLKINLLNRKFYTLEEFEKKFPLKIGETVITTLNHVGTIIGITNGKYKVLFREDSALIAPHRLKLYKEMERNVTLTLDKAKEWYNKGGELREIALQAFTRAELNPLPKSWEEFCKQGNLIASWRYHIPTKYEALFKLEHLRDCWWGNWKPEWNASHKYAIKNLQGELTIIGCSNVAAFLVFPTGEMAEEFLKCFRDLIELAKDLI